jgi:hypothetical protein
MGCEPADRDASTTSPDDVCASDDIDAPDRATVGGGLGQQCPVPCSPSFAPGARYEVGQRVGYQGGIARVLSVHRRGNASQGAFDVVELQMPDGTVQRGAAGIEGAPAAVSSSAVVEAATVQAAGEQARQFGAALNQHSRAGQRLRRSSAAPSRLYKPGASHALDLPCLRLIELTLASLRESEAALARAQFESIQHLGRQMLDAERSGKPHALSAAETWRQFVRPTLALLGWTFTPLQGDGFVLFPDPGTDIEKGPRAVVVALGWGARLAYGAEEGREASPVIQVIGAMAEAGARWAILTNGRRWRLYGAARGNPDSGSTAGEFIEFDLGQVFAAAGDETPRPAHLALFNRWWLLFRSKALMEGFGGTSLWQELRSETGTYARHIVRRLRELLPASVLPDIAGGFLAYRFHQSGLQDTTAQDLQEISRACLILVYRLLFLLYARQREQVPVADAGELGESLATLVRRALSVEDEGRCLSDRTQPAPMYESLLAHICGLGPDCGDVSAPEDAALAFLKRHRLSDRVVARTLAALVRIDGAHVDYRSLTLRHLGAAGEGLSEMTLRVGGGPAGHVELLNARGEAHAPVGAPLPDDIGVPAVERALAQVLAVRGEHYRTAMDRVLRARRQASGTTGDRDPLVRAEQEARDALLGVRVLDLAMGTGTFLLPALDILVDGIMECVAGYHRSHPWVSWESDPVVRTLREARGALRLELQARGYAHDPELLGDEVMLAWLLARDAIYGVDLDETAVALSRAIVRMRVFPLDVPWPSLSGHLIEGNSLLGLRLTTQGPADLTGDAFVWDLAFPDVFRPPVSEGDDRGATEPGFDVVISNPPAQATQRPAQAGASPVQRWDQNDFLEMARRLTRKPHGRIAFVVVPSADTAGD